MGRYKFLIIPPLILMLISGFLLINMLYKRHAISEIYKWERLICAENEAQRKLIEWREVRIKSFWEKCYDVCREECYRDSKEKCENYCTEICTDINTQTYIYTAFFLISLVFTLALIYHLKKTKPS